MKEDRLRSIVREVIKEALTVEITMEKVRDEKTGQPLSKPEIIKEEVFLPSFLTQVLSFQEGALRGLQEDGNKKDNKIDRIYESFPILIDYLGGLTAELGKLKKQEGRLIDEGKS